MNPVDWETAVNGQTRRQTKIVFSEYHATFRNFKFENDRTACDTKSDLSGESWPRLTVLAVARSETCR